MRPTTLLPVRRKACWGFFRPKNPNLVTKGQHATSRQPKPLGENWGSPSHVDDKRWMNVFGGTYFLHLKNDRVQKLHNLRFAQRWYGVRSESEVHHEESAVRAFPVFPHVQIWKLTVCPNTSVLWEQTRKPYKQSAAGQCNGKKRESCRIGKLNTPCSCSAFCDGLSWFCSNACVIPTDCDVQLYRRFLWRSSLSLSLF
jgi:hypothetical protein